MRNAWRGPKDFTWIKTQLRLGRPIVTVLFHRGDTQEYDHIVLLKMVTSSSLLTGHHLGCGGTHSEVMGMFASKLRNKLGHAYIACCLCNRCRARTQIYGALQTSFV